MKIKKLSAKYHPTGVEIQNVEFDDTLSLLVGISGVGKTRILTAIKNLTEIIMGNGINGLEWNIEFEIDDSLYKWKGQFEYKQENPFLSFIKRFESTENNSVDYNIIFEELYIDGEEVIKRYDNEIYFQNNKTVKLATNKSALNLLKEEEALQYVFHHFLRIKIIDFSEYSESMISVTSPDFNIDNISEIVLKHLSYKSPTKLFICQNKFPEKFSEIVNVYKEIFPYVDDVKVDEVGMSGGLDGFQQYVISIKEKGIDTWVNQSHISTGMLKTLIHLAYLYLSPQGSVFLIDEFENGFGVNCINSISDLVLNAGNDYQFIMTSHHPYIINHIPVEKWKIVNRTKNIITAESATKHIDASNHDAFIKLINSNFYTKGIEVNSNDDELTEDDLYS